MATVLIVDDEPYIREVLIQRLRNRSFDAYGAANAEEALAKIGAKAFDVVVLDLLMPGGHGNEVLDMMQNRPKPRIIVLSALAEVWHRRHRDTNAFAVLQKPVGFDELVRVIESAVR